MSNFCILIGTDEEDFDFAAIYAGELHSLYLKLKTTEFKQFKNCRTILENTNSQTSNNYQFKIKDYNILLCLAFSCFLLLLQSLQSSSQGL